MKKFTFTCLFILSLPFSMHAISLEVQVDTGKEIINALGATIHVPDGIKIDAINNGNSTILFWIEAPTYDDKSDTITFSGITPGGFQGRYMVLTISGDFTVEDSKKFTFSNVQALKDDGAGTPVSVNLSLAEVKTREDIDPPEDFIPLIGQDNNVYDGQYFLVFTTQDKGVGIDHYEVREGYFGKFTTAESPYLLGQQSLDKKIFVKAFDKSGNMRSVTLEAPHPNKWYRYVLFAILLVVILVSSPLVKKPWLKLGK